MAAANKSARTVRRSISLSRDTDRAVQSIARRTKSSANRVFEDLIAAGLQAKEAEKQRFFEIAGRLRKTANEAEAQRLKKELARMTFGN